LFGLLFAFLLAPKSAFSQETPEAEPDSAAADTVEPLMLNPINVTATRETKGVFETAAPVSVVDTQLVRERSPNNAADLIKSLPGIDINGVGANQERPTIRGQRGQRILLLENGLRLNNARRQADFGEIPAIVDIKSVERVEVVRGPASVLYGSDAIGGVVNMITSEPPRLSEGDVWRGEIGLSYRNAGDQLWPTGEAWGRAGRFGWGVSASYRNVDDYKAPAGSFGQIQLDESVYVNGSGVQDQNYGAYLDYSFDDRQRIYGSFDYYSADEAAFGYVSNADLDNPFAPDLDITYPQQTVSKFSAGYRGAGLNTALFDRADVSLSYLDNERQLNFGLVLPDPTGPLTLSQNFTDLESVGIRAEAAKLLANSHVLTYGLDYYHDDSKNVDRDGSGETTQSKTPNATYDRFGAFAQVDLILSNRVALIVGGRYQGDRAKPQDSPNFQGPLPEESSNDAFVGAANLLFEVVPSLNLVGTVGRGFRSPNIIELFFNGSIPEANAFQTANPELNPEKNLNVDLGVKYRRSRIAFEAFYFRNWLTDGIRIAATGDTVLSDIGPVAEFQNVNVDELTFQGIEALLEFEVYPGLTLGASYTWLDGDDENDANDENNPISDTYSSRVTGQIAYRQPSGQWWASWDVRLNGEQKNSDFILNTPVCGTEPDCAIPSFTVMNLRAGVRVFDMGRTSSSLIVGIENLTNELYAEVSNSSFFRPAAERTFLVSWVTSF
jgi:outer membrane receptor protein involved in Fe transport